jgi:uncharacterized protein
MRRHDRQLANEEAYQLLLVGEYGVLSINGSEGAYGVPLNYVVDGQAVYFHCAMEGTKLNLIQANPYVSFCVVGKTQVMPEKFGTLYESVIVSGKAENVEGEEKQKALELFIQKYSPEYIAEGQDYIQKLFDRVKIIRLSIATITGKSRKH